MTRKEQIVAASLITAGAVVIAPVRHVLLRGLSLLAVGHVGPLREYLLSLGLLGPVISVALMIAESVAIPVPVTLIMIANGLVFGLWPGMAISFIGTFLGAVCAYTLGRSLGRTAAERLLPPSVIRSAELFMQRRGPWALVLARWVPGMPCDPASYVAGITRMPVLGFLFFTILGLLPATAGAAFLGVETASAADSIYWTIGIVALGAALIAWWLIRHHRRQS